MGFLAIVSLILIIAKIFNLVSIGWIMCFLPFIIGASIKAVILIIIFIISLFS